MNEGLEQQSISCSRQSKRTLKLPTKSSYNLRLVACDRMQHCQGRTHYSLIRIGRLHRINRIGELRHFRHKVKPAGFYMRLHRAHPEIPGTARRKNIAECERAEIERKVRRSAREIHPVVKSKIRTPIHVHIIGFVQDARFGIGSHEHELFLHEQIDFQTRPVLGRIHDRNVDHSRRDLIDQILRHIDMYAKCNILQRAAHPSDPIEQQRLPRLTSLPTVRTARRPGGTATW